MALPANFYRAAQVLIDQYGGSAEAHARAKLANCVRINNPVAAAAWRMIIIGLEELQSRELAKVD